MTTTHLTTTATAFIGANPIRTVTDPAGNLWYYAADAYSSICNTSRTCDVGRILKKVCQNHTRMGSIIPPRKDVIGLDTISTTWLINEADLIRVCLYLRVGKSAAIKDVILGQINDFRGVLDALNSFEVPDDLPDLFVYAIQEVETGRIKLGISRDPQQRLMQLQTGNSQKLKLIASRKAVNRFADERALHTEARAHHIHGEWFTHKAAGVLQ